MAVARRQDTDQHLEELKRVAQEASAHAEEMVIQERESLRSEIDLERGRANDLQSQVTSLNERVSEVS
jgi:50S ribosomal subunit-associated GTPase HflX